MKALTVAVVVALSLSAMFTVFSFAVLDFTTPQFRFTWVYSEVVIGETLLLLLVAVFLILPFNRRFGSILRHEVQLARPVRALAALALVVGLLLFAFWAMVDLLGGYGGPGHTFSTYPLIASVYNSVWFLHGQDQMGKEGFLSFCVATIGFIALRARHGVGTAVKDGVTLFAAPIVMVFEFALWYFMPVVMYWKVTGFAPWSLGTYLTVDQFASMMHTGFFTWAGNIYLLSNWFVLMAASFLTLVGFTSFLVRKELEREDRLVGWTTRTDLNR